MLGKLTFAFAFLMAGAALAEPKDDLDAVAKKLGDEGYTWKSSLKTEMVGGRSVILAREAKIDKEGRISSQVLVTRFDGSVTPPIEAVVKGKKGAIKTQDGWQPISEVAKEEPGNRDRMVIRAEARRLQEYEPPHEQIKKMAAKDGKFSVEGDVIRVELSEATARWAAGVPQGDQAPTVSNLKSVVKFWLKAGSLTKFQVDSEYTLSNGDRESKWTRTAVMEFKDVGSTTVEIPAEARKKLE